MAMLATRTRDVAEQRAGILTARLLGLCGVVATTLGAFYLLLSAVPAHAATLGGDLAAGAATGALMAATIAGELAAGRLLAWLGRRGVMIVALLALGIPALASFSDNLWLVLLSCAVRGFGLGLLLIAAYGLAAVIAPPARLAETLGVYGFASALPGMVGVPLGPWALAHLGPSAMAIVACGLALAGFGGLWAFPSRCSADAAVSQAPRPLRFQDAAWPTTALAVGATVVGASITFLPVAHGEVGQATVMTAMLGQGLAAAASRWACGRWIDRQGPGSGLAAGVVLALAAALILAARGEVPVLAGMTAGGLAFGGLQSASFAQLLSRAPVQADEVSTVWNVAYDAGLGLGGLGFGALAEASGYGAGFVALAFVLASAAIASLAISSRRERPC